MLEMKKHGVKLVDYNHFMDVEEGNGNDKESEDKDEE